MSDRAPKVTVEPVGDGRWMAACRELDCGWEHQPDQKTYVNERARAHRGRHRAADAEPVIYTDIELPEDEG